MPNTPAILSPLFSLLFLLLPASGTRAAAAAAAAGPATQPASPAEHVLVIGLDGARADALRDHPGPAIRSFVDRGTVCWNAQAAKPTVTQVNWPSILTSCTPAHHGMTKHPVTEADLAGRHVDVPTVFDVVARHGGAAIGYLGHFKLYSVESDTPGTHFEHSPYQAREIAPVAARHFVAEKPAFMFVYFGNLDGLGHNHGWMSPEYLAGIPAIDKGIQTMLDAVEKAGLKDSTLVIVTSDHGGHDKGHSQGTPEDSTVPLLLLGPTVRQHHEITRPVPSLDTAATALHALHIPAPQEWDGHPLLDAFTDTPED